MLMKISFGNPAHVMKLEAIFVKDHQRVNNLKNVPEIMTYFLTTKRVILGVKLLNRYELTGMV